MTNKMQLKRDLKEKRELINITLDRYLPRKDEYPKEIHKAIRHSLFAGGKRLRPYLAICSYLLFDENIQKVKEVAAAIEMLHTYTLIHDDLPSLDDDDYRRGKKTCHVVFGEDIALLAGDALLTFAFEIIANTALDEKLKLKLIKELAYETGFEGLIAGQMKDIICEGKKVTKSNLEYIHHNKTGRLLSLPMRFGAYIAEASEKDVKRLNNFGEKIGLAFQIVDDILDIEGNSKILGKTTGKDSEVEKTTFPALYGLEKSKEMAANLIDDAKHLLKPYGEKAEMLLLLCDYLLTRKF